MNMDVEGTGNHVEGKREKARRIRLGSLTYRQKKKKEGGVSGKARKADIKKAGVDRRLKTQIFPAFRGEQRKKNW